MTTPPTDNEPHASNAEAELGDDTGTGGRTPSRERLPVLTVGDGARAALGGALMGIANLVPGISGGTMLVATGIYTRFIEAIADVTRLRLRPASIALLVVVGVSAGVAIVALAGVIATALIGFRWGMFSLFIGLTLGGAPLLLGMIRKAKGGFGPPAVVGLVIGLVVMAGLVLLQALGGGGGGSRGDSYVMLAVGGAAAASAMILPGVSGAYLLLLLGLYDTIINAIKVFARAAIDRDIDAALGELGVIVPVGIGVVVGVVGVSNLLKFLLRRYERQTLGALLGLLIAAPLGLYPFREGIPPEVGETIRGEVVTAEMIDANEIDPKDWRQATFTPTAGHVAGSAGLIVLGVAATLGIARLGRERPTG
ncbi:MAG: DUF368 domain-containing protein [Planctomycetota bacterium]